MTMPVSIESNRYERNALLFNVGFVFAVDDDATCYEPVVRKVAKTLRALEVSAIPSHARALAWSGVGRFMTPPPSPRRRCRWRCHGALVARWSATS